MIEACRAIELGHDRWQFHADPPFVGAAARCDEPVAPLPPPPRHEARHRFDDEHAIASGRAGDQPFEQPVACSVRQLVHRERRKDQRGTSRQRRGGGVAPTGPGVEIERAIGPRRFTERPRMAIDPDDARRRGAGAGPCGTRRAGPAAKIDERRGCRRRAGERIHDVLKEQIMERAVEERERGPLAGAGERGAVGERLSPFHVGGRQCTERARHLREPKVREVSRLKRCDPMVEAVVANGLA